MSSPAGDASHPAPPVEPPVPVSDPGNSEPSPYGPNTPLAISRRAAVLAFAGGAGLAALSALFAPFAAAGRDPLAGGSTNTDPMAVASWRTTHTSRVFIAHRGSGDVYPEHSMEAYQAAFDWGATCMEISVAVTSDGVLICMHDGTYDRTTNGKGVIADQPSSVLQQIRIWEPQLGSGWTDNPPRIPLFEDVLKAFGKKVVLCVEAKVPAAYQPMMALVEKYGLRDYVIVKGTYDNTQIFQAQAAGYPIFCYFGAPDDVTLAEIEQLGGQLRPERDYLVVAGLRSAPDYLPDDLIRAAVATGVPVWIHPLHRRIDATHFFDLGVQGVICASYGYIAGVTRPVSGESWGDRKIASGEVSRSPASESYAPSFTADGQLMLSAKAVQHFITLGQFCPVPAAAASYVIDVDLSWVVPPKDPTDNLTIAFGHEDDRYYEHRAGFGTGYHLILRGNGELGLYLHSDGVADGQPLAPPVQTPTLNVGDWAHLRISVTPERITAKRTDTGATITATDTTVRGGYVHVGRASTNGTASFRGFSIS